MSLGGTCGLELDSSGEVHLDSKKNLSAEVILCSFWCLQGDTD